MWTENRVMIQTYFYFLAKWYTVGWVHGMYAYTNYIIQKDVRNQNWKINLQSKFRKVSENRIPFNFILLYHIKIFSINKYNLRKLDYLSIFARKFMIVGADTINNYYYKIDRDDDAPYLFPVSYLNYYRMWILIAIVLRFIFRKLRLSVIILIFFISCGANAYTIIIINFRFKKYILIFRFVIHCPSLLFIIIYFCFLVYFRSHCVTSFRL